jgi:hypothetical protein
MTSQRVLKLVGMLGGVILLGIGVGYIASKNPSVTLPPSKDTNTPVIAGNAKTSTGPSRVHLGDHHWPSGSSNALAIAPAPTAAPQNLITNWEEKIDELLGSEGEEADKAKKMLEMFPQLPAEGQVEVAQHLSNLVSDENYAPLGKLLTNDALPEDVLDVLLADALNRPNSLKLPLFLEIARDAQHPKAAEAKDMLELFLEEDYGSNWGQWQAKMDQWLKDNPD